MTTAISARKLEVILADMIRDPSSPNYFFSHLLITMTRTETKQVPTMGVYIRNGQINLVWNPDFIGKLSYLEILAVFEHECMHLILDHITRGEGFNHQLFNIAADMAINQLINNLPVGGIDYRDFKYPAGLTTEGYYILLDRDAKTSPTGSGGKGSGKGKTDEKGEGQGQGDGQGEDGEGGGYSQSSITAPNGKQQTTVDCHDKWGASESDKELDREVIKQAIEHAHEQVVRSQGHMPSSCEELVKAWLKPPSIPWQRVLKTFISNSIKSGMKRSWKRPSRRFGNTVKGRLPDRTLRLAVAIDTSGSISTEDLQEFCSEIEGIRKNYRSDITIFECDAAIAKTYSLKTFGKIDMNFKGRGGTSFVPVFEEISKKHLCPDLLVYLTDLYGSFPDKAPAYRVMWVTPSAASSVDKVPFGRVLNITHNKKSNK